MGILDAIRDLGWRPPEHPEGLEGMYGDPFRRRGVFRLYSTRAHNFEVLDGGEWYKIDTKHLGSELYEGTGVPETVLARARNAISPVYEPDSYDWREDPTQPLLAALRREFDDARFVNMTYRPGVYY